MRKSTLGLILIVASGAVIYDTYRVRGVVPPDSGGDTGGVVIRPPVTTPDYDDAMARLEAAVAALEESQVDEEILLSVRNLPGGSV